MVRFFIIQGPKMLYGKLSCEKQKMLATLQAFFISFARKLAQQKVFLS
jgi:hypothetical protein